MREPTDVLVVGAGPTGLFLAAQLARHGVRPRVVDARPAAVSESRALAVHARALEALDELGLAGELVARGRRVPAFSMWAGSRRLARLRFDELPSRFPFLLDVPQHETEAVLRRHLATVGVEVEGGTELIDLRTGPHRVDATTRCGERVDVAPATYVVGCDGSRSAVRRLLGVPFDGDSYPQDWLLADVALDWDRPTDELQVVFHKTGRTTVFMPLPDGRWRVILYFAGESAADASPPTLGDVERLVHARVPGRIEITDPTWLARFRTHRRSAASYRCDRVLLAGDAVHVHSPAGGQGLNTGLLDAHNLAWKLAAVVARRAPATLLDTYGEERRPVAAGVLAMSHRLVQLSAVDTPAGRLARSLAVPVVSRLPRARRRIVARMAQLHVEYRSSSLAARPAPGGRSRRGPRPGDRAPDAGGLLHDGRATQLHELLHDPRHTLLLLLDGPGGTAPADRAVGALAGHEDDVRVVAIRRRSTAPFGRATVAVDRRGEAHRAYLGAGPVHLVRPDGYVAASTPAAIAAHLARVSRPAAAAATARIAAGAVAPGGS